MGGTYVGYVGSDEDDPGDVDNTDGEGVSAMDVMEWMVGAIPVTIRRNLGGVVGRRASSVCADFCAVKE